MTKHTKPFDFEGKRIRTITIDEVSYYCAFDVLNIIGFTNKTQALRTHCTPDYMSITSNTYSETGKRRNRIFITQDNVLRLVSGTTKKSATIVKTWLENEVFPSLIDNQDDIIQPTKEIKMNNPFLLDNFYQSIDCITKKLEDNSLSLTCPVFIAINEYYNSNINKLKSEITDKLKAIIDANRINVIPAKISINFIDSGPYYTEYVVSIHFEHDVLEFKYIDYLICPIK